jgi:urea transport system permease protein
MGVKALHHTLLCILCLFAASARAETGREALARAILEPGDAEKRTRLLALAGTADEAVIPLLELWKKDALFIVPGPAGGPTPVELTGSVDAEGRRVAVRVDTGKPLLDATGLPVWLAAKGLKSAEHNGALRKAMRAVSDLADLASPDSAKKLRAIGAVGQSQDAEKLPVLQKRLELEKDPAAIKALREAAALVRLNLPDRAQRLAAVRELDDLQSLASTDFLAKARAQAEAAKDAELVAALRSAELAVGRHRTVVDGAGTLFRSLSLGSILLIVALGLAITFGQMGVINMAHGEMIAIGAYTTYVVQNLFTSGLALSPFGFSVSIPGLHATGGWKEAYFLFALPLSFLAAAGAGLLLERTVIRFLYRRPLESLLATWGVSLLLQQCLRLTFGANNVQVGSPTYLSGNWIIGDVLLGWNRVFVIGFAACIVLGVWLVLTRTSLGLLIRCVTQNRTMAACMGVRTERVNMLTFALGSGLAGLAGAFLSQIGNVGPSLGQSYIVDSFMVVVVGGVGNLVGTVISALGIGTFDQFTQQYAPAFANALAGVPFVGGFLQNLAQDSAVFGKILVLCVIILFLQWRPSGLFAARSRSLD